MKFIQYVVCSLLVMTGCINAQRVIDISLDRGQITGGESSPIPENLESHYRGAKDVYRISISPRTNLRQCLDLFSDINLNLNRFVVHMKNGKDEFLHIGYPGDYLPYECSKETTCFILTDMNYFEIKYETVLETDDLSELWKMASTNQKPRGRLSPVRKKGASNYLLICSQNVTFGQIEEYLIDARRNGYGRFFLIVLEI